VTSVDASVGPMSSPDQWSRTDDRGTVIRSSNDAGRPPPAPSGR
jgi:hypothetical protein